MPRSSRNEDSEGWKGLVSKRETGVARQEDAERGRVGRYRRRGANCEGRIAPCTERTERLARGEGKMRVDRGRGKVEQMDGGRREERERR